MQRRIQLDNGADSADFEPVVLYNIQNCIKATRNIKHVKPQYDNCSEERDSLLDESTRSDEAWGPPAEIGRITEESLQASEDSPVFEINFKQSGMFSNRQHEQQYP